MKKDKIIGVGFGVMILKNNKILLGKRNSDPRKASSLLGGAGTWTMPGGKLHFMETFEEGAHREVLEETGIKIRKSKLKIISISNDIAKSAHFVTIGFLSKDFIGRPKIMEPDEITEWKYFNLNKLPKPLFPPSEKIIVSYKKLDFL